MAGVDVGSGGGKRRPTNGDINMIPFIDLLMVTIAFLLITAVWVQHSRVDATAQVPGENRCTDDCPEPERGELHVTLREDRAELQWKRKGVVVESREIELGAREGGRLPALARAIQQAWQTHGSHREPSDAHKDRLVLHTSDREPYSSIVSALDAAYGTRRPMRRGTQVSDVPAFAVTFAAR
jgi:biopolymer transport protein ExbD